MNSKKPYLIAEISANHNGSFLTAKKLIKCAKVNGADAVKLQTYQADTMTLKSDKRYFQLKSGLWKNYTLWNLYNQAKTPLEWHKKLFDYAKKCGARDITLMYCVSNYPSKNSDFNLNNIRILKKFTCKVAFLITQKITELQ